MTVGLYLNEPFPILISDCLALPIAGAKQIFSPSNIECYDGKNGEFATLVSKFIYADENTIITFAGNYSDIKEFLDCFPNHWEARDRNLRPMQFLRELDYQLRAVRPGWSCSVLGASVVPNVGEANEDVMNNYASLNDNWSFETNHFGRCLAIGTGSDELRKFIENADKNIDRLGTAGDDFLFKLLGGLNAKALFLQVEEVKNQTWGGLLQAQLYHNKACKWLRTPPWFHMGVFLEGKGLTFKGTHRKNVLHTSIQDDMHDSAVVTGITKDDGNSETIIWPVHSPFISAEERKKIQYSQFLQRPNMITITSFIEIEQRMKINHSTYPADYVKGVTFDINDGYFGWKVEDNELGDWLQQEMLNDPSVTLLLN